MTTSIELYGAPGTASLVAHWLLIELEVPHALRPLDLDRREHKEPWYLALNPAGVVPTLVIDGAPVTEAAAIAMHLADLYPAARLAPAVGTPARAAYYQWMCFCANTLQPAYRAWFYPAEPAGEAYVDAAKGAARAAIEAGLDRVAAHLDGDGRPYVLGDAPTAVDFLLTMLLRWSRNMPRPSDRWRTLAAYARRMKDRPSFREVYAREGLTDWT